MHATSNGEEGSDVVVTWVGHMGLMGPIGLKGPIRPIRPMRPITPHSSVVVVEGCVFGVAASQQVGQQIEDLFFIEGIQQAGGHDGHW